MFKWENVDLLADTRWQGTFFPPDKMDERFFGTLTHSATEGLFLEYTMLGGDAPEIAGVLHGVLATGEAVTLLRHHEGLQPGSSFQYGTYTLSGKAYFWAMCAGLHFNAEPSFKRLDFTLSGLDEFIVPQGNTAYVPWAHQPIIAAKMPDGELQLINAGKVQPVGHLSSVLVNRNPTALAVLESHFQAVKSAFPKDIFLLKREMHYLLRLEYEEAVTLTGALSRMTDIGALFALLVRAPVHARRISFTVKDQKDTSAEIFVFPAGFLEEATVRLALERKNHHLMPITMQNAGLEKLVPVWLTEAVNHRVLVSGLQHQTGWRTWQDTHGALVLYATQLEAILIDEKGPKGKKFEYAIGKYASPKVLALLKHHLGAATLHEVGEGVSDVRNEIAHVGKPPKLLKKLNGNGLSEIALCLELIVVGYVLRKLGVDAAVVEAYQDGFAPEA